MTVAGCPTLTLPISDSLSGTTSFIELRSLSTAKDELVEPLEPEFELDELPVEPPPAPSPAASVAELLDEEPSELLDALLVPPPETVSPTSPESETIVPSCGAIRLGVGDGLFVALDGQAIALDCARPRRCSLRASPC